MVGANQILKAFSCLKNGFPDMKHEKLANPTLG